MAETETPEKKEPKLTNRQRAFILEYTTHFNATKAAINAGYSEKTAGMAGYENLKKPYIAAKIQEVFSKKAKSSDEVLARFADLMDFDIGNYMDDQGHLDIDELRLKGSRFIKKINVKKDGMLEYEFHNAQDAMKDMAKCRALFTDNVKVDGKLEVKEEVQVTFVDPNKKPEPPPDG